MFQVFLNELKPLKGEVMPTDTLHAVEQEFVDLWRRMSALWGISPTMAEIHGLLFITGTELSMDDIMERLAISRSNVSMNVSKLVEWGLIRRVHKRGDRRDYYESLHETWEMFALVVEQRKRREIDPILNTLQRCQAQLSPEQLGAAAETNDAADRRRRINELLSLLTLMDTLATRFFETHRGLKSAMEKLNEEPR
jgi:DNA-binding transcriptional regulator GbsR (MarR family)